MQHPTQLRGNPGGGAVSCRESTGPAPFSRQAAALRSNPRTASPNRPTTHPLLRRSIAAHPNKPDHPPPAVTSKYGSYTDPLTPKSGPPPSPNLLITLQIVKNWYLFVCVASGLWGGLAIGLQTEYFTSNRYKPVQVRALHTRTCVHLCACVCVRVGVFFCLGACVCLCGCEQGACEGKLTLVLSPGLLEGGAVCVQCALSLL
jgi:hypothetical protein